MFEQAKDYEPYREKMVSSATCPAPIPLRHYAGNLFEDIQTTEDIQSRTRELTGVLIDSGMHPYGKERYSTCKAIDIHNFHFGINWPVHEVQADKDSPYDTAKVKKGDTRWRGITDIIAPDEGEEWKTINEPRKSEKNPNWERTGEFKGRRDLVKELFKAEGFIQELANRLWVNVEEVQRVVNLAIQVIGDAEENPEESMRTALKLIIDKFSIGENFAACSARQNEDLVIEQEDEYILLNWLKWLKGEEREMAAMQIIERIYKLSDEDLDTAARCLTRFSTQIFTELGNDKVKPHPYFDYNELFDKEVDLLWSKLLETKVEGAGAKLRECLGEDRQFLGKHRDKNDFNYDDAEKALIN
ncbi:hypothetical protein ACFLZH_05620 [Patescibacteria group bacterium]